MSLTDLAISLNRNPSTDSILIVSKQPNPYLGWWSSGQGFLSFLPWKYSNYLTLFTRFAAHFHHFSTQKHAISTTKQNNVLHYIFLSVWRSQKAKYLVLCYTKNRSECSRLGEVWWKMKQWLQCSLWDWEQERLGKYFHKENQTFASHTPESQSLEYLLFQQKQQATEMMLCIPPWSRRTVISRVYLSATSSLQSLMVLVCYHCFSQQCIVPIFLPQVHYAHKRLFIQRKIIHTRKYIMQIFTAD